MLASQKTIDYLRNLGYEGDTSNLSQEDASYLIQQMVGGSKPRNENKEAEKPTTTNQPTTANPPASKAVNAVIEKNISDKVLNQINNLVDSQGLVLPPNYNSTNALKSAYLKLAENNLLGTDQLALAEALLNMCIQGLNPAKNQCYFINYGGKVNMMRSYFGDRTVAINTGLVKDVQANVIYEGDEVNVFYENDYIKIEHKTNWKNLSNAIIGAYAFAVMPDGTKRYDIMTLDRIKKSWAMSKNNTNNKLQNSFTDDACKRTVIRHLVKMIFNETGDSQVVVESYNNTTEKEYIDTGFESKETKNASIEEVNNEQMQMNASESFDVVDEETGEVAQDGLFSEFINQK